MRQLYDNGCAMERITPPGENRGEIAESIAKHGDKLLLMRVAARIRNARVPDRAAGVLDDIESDEAQGNRDDGQADNGTKAMRSWRHRNSCRAAY